MKINWDKELVNRINEDLAKGMNFPQIAKQLRRETGIKYNKDDVRLGYQRHTDWIEDGETVKPLANQALSKAFKNVANAMNSINESKNTVTADNVDITQPIEFKKLSDGSYSSARTLNLSDDELKDEATLLKLHGYDPVKWEIKTSSNSRNTRETNKGTKHSYNSRITVKPKTALTLDDLKKELTKTYVEPMEVYKNNPVDSEPTEYSTERIQAVYYL